MTSLGRERMGAGASGIAALDVRCILEVSAAPPHL
jgi:hypothetical protein